MNWNLKIRASHIRYRKLVFSEVSHIRLGNERKYNVRACVNLNVENVKRHKNVQSALIIRIVF